MLKHVDSPLLPVLQFVRLCGKKDINIIDDKHNQQPQNGFAMRLMSAGRIKTITDDKHNKNMENICMLKHVDSPLLLVLQFVEFDSAL